ncbi:MAG TPA: DUF1189 family protein, partial [Bacillales bacterium]
PKKEPFFRLNRMRMSNAIVYLFCLMFIASIPGGVAFFLSDHPADVPPTLFVLQFVFFYYVFFSFFGLLSLSVLALITLWLSKGLQRKLTYRQLWKMSAYAITLPLLLYTLAESLNVNNGFILSFLFLLSLGLVSRLITVFPKRSA